MSAESRDVTPSTASSPSTQSNSAIIDRATSHASTGESVAEDAEKFRKRLELEQTMQVLQQRLELANLKAKNGWSGMSIDEIENRLPPRRRREDMRVVTGREGSGTVYEPPSPSRPWQLVDVLWQPLPPPSRGSYPASPSSPLKRSRADDGPGPSSQSTMDRVINQRRASGSLNPTSPLESIKRREKKRSQSHSHPIMPTTTQDFNAARALTEMLSSSPSSPYGSGSGRGRGHDLSHNPSLPLPPAFDGSARKNHSSRRSSSATPSVRKPRRPSRPEPDEEDANAAELMMFLAHSPSSVTKPPNPIKNRSIGTTARVLFADDQSQGGRKMEERSNLGLVPPITASDERFGGLLE